MTIANKIRAIRLVVTKRPFIAVRDSSKLAFNVICQLATQLSVEFFRRPRVAQRRGECRILAIAGLGRQNIHTQRLVILAGKELTKHLVVTVSTDVRNGRIDARLGPCQILTLKVRGVRNESLFGNFKQETQDNALILRQTPFRPPIALTDAS